MIYGKKGKIANKEIGDSNHDLNSKEVTATESTEM